MTKSASNPTPEPGDVEPRLRTERATHESVFRITPEPPFRLDLTAWALRRRAVNRVTTWDGVHLARVLPGPAPIGLDVTQEGQELVVRAIGSLPEPELRERASSGVRKLLGVDQDLRGYWAMASADAVLAPYVERFRGFRPPRYPSVFEALLNAVACQQVSLEVGLTLLGRLADRYGGPPGPLGPLRLPSPTELAAADPELIAGMGFSRAKVKTLLGLATAFADGELDEATLDSMPTDAIEPALSSYFGIGRWSCDYVCLRGLARFDVFPVGDSGARRGVARAIGLDTVDVARVDATIEDWRPYGGLAYLTLLLAGLDAKGALPG